MDRLPNSSPADYGAFGGDVKKRRATDSDGSKATCFLEYHESSVGRNNGRDIKVITNSADQLSGKTQGERHTLLPSASEFGALSRQMAFRKLEESVTHTVFFVEARGPESKVRFSKPIEDHMYQEGLSENEIVNAFCLAGNDKNNPATRYHFVQNLRVNEYLSTLTQYDNNDSFQEKVFEHRHEKKTKNEWQPAVHYFAEAIPGPLVDPRYIMICDVELSTHGECDGYQATLSTRNLDYITDKTAELLVETLSVFHHITSSGRSDREKLMDLRSLLSPDKSGNFPGNGLNDGAPTVARLSAEKYLERIRYASGGAEYLSLLEKNPRYKQGTI